MASLNYIKQELGDYNYNAWMEDVLRAYELRLLKGERQSLYDFIDSSIRTRFEQRKIAFQEHQQIQDSTTRNKSLKTNSLSQ